VVEDTVNYQFKFYSLFIVGNSTFSFLVENPFKKLNNKVNFLFLKD